jgi:hypothetical protein
VKAPRFRIARIMAFIAIAAFDLGAIREMFGSRTAFALLLGVLPMANILAVAILVGQQRPGSRQFLLGFEAFGAMAMVSYAALVTYVPGSYERIDDYLGLWVDFVAKIIGGGRPLLFVPIGFCGMVIMLGWPQVAFALVGGLLSSKFRATITRR